MTWGHEGGFAAALIAPAGGGREAEKAIALAGGTLAGRVGWAALDDLPDARVLVVETRGVSDDALAALLPVIDELARDRAMPVVVALDETQIDVVTAALFGLGIHLLVAPPLATRVATLVAVGVVVGGDDHGAAVREDDGDRLRRQDVEIARIAGMLMRLTRADDGADTASIADRRRGFGAEPAGDERVDPAMVRRAIRARRMRDQFFGAPESGGGLFEDPAWYMLLDLFAAELEDVRVSVSSLCIAAAVAPTTALRWVGRLTAVGLFERRADPVDRRRAFVVLSDAARSGMRGYVAALRGGGLVRG